MQYTDGMTHFHIDGVISYENDIRGFSSYAEMKKTTELTFKSSNSSNPDLKCYRVFTPGHWEDANGNWINGSWSDWRSIQPGYEVTGDGAQFGDPDSWYFVSGGIPSGNLPKSSNLALWRGDLCEQQNVPFAERTWINTVPEPNA